MECRKLFLWVIYPSEKIKISKRAIQEESEQEEDFLKQNKERFSFGEFPIKFCETSVIENNVDGVRKFIRESFE